MEYWIWIAAVCLLGINGILGAGVIAADRRQKKQTPKEDAVSVEPDAAINNVFMNFLPIELLRLLGIENTFSLPADIPSGQKEVQAVILNGDIAEFSELTHGMEITRVYSLINRTLSYMVPAVYKNGGMIDSFQNAGIRALFTGQMEDGLNAAVSACEEMIQLEGGKNYRNFSIGLCYGRVSIGIVGYAKRLSVLTLSTYTGLGRFLQGMGPKYYAKILAAGSYVEQVRGFTKNYNHRFLGIFFVRNTGSEEKIYDIFDGDEAGIRNRKRKTKMLFEKGVELFLARDFTESRIYFIEVLKADQHDRAAREYVYLCDRYGSKTWEEAQTADIFLECF